MNISLKLSAKKQVRGSSPPLAPFWLSIHPVVRLWNLDHVQMTALTRALKLNLNVAYLDGRSPTGKVDFVEFRDPDAPPEYSYPITLLYR